MKFKSFFLLLIVTMLFPFFAGAAEQDNALLRKVVTALEGPFKPDAGKSAPIRDFQVDFSQESEIASLGQKQTAQGQAAFRFLPWDEKRLVSPLFRWEYREPHQQKIVSDGISVWFHIPENQQAIRSEARRSLTGEEGANPLLFLTHIGELSRFFKIRWATPRRNEGQDYLLELTPLEKTPLLRTLLLEVSRQALDRKTKTLVFPLRAIVLTNVNGDRSRITFSNPRLNGDLPLKSFVFTPPQGTDILTPEQFRKAFQ